MRMNHVEPQRVPCRTPPEALRPKAVVKIVIYDVGELPPIVRRVRCDHDPLPHGGSLRFGLIGTDDANLRRHHGDENGAMQESLHGSVLVFAGKPRMASRCPQLVVPPTSHRATHALVDWMALIQVDRMYFYQSQCTIHVPYDKPEVGSLRKADGACERWMRVVTSVSDDLAAHSTGVRRQVVECPLRRVLV